MASEKIIMKRAQLAASFSRAARTTVEGKAFVEAVMESSPEQAELTVVPAAAEESAVLTFHRIERLNVPVVVLVTNDGNEIVARNLLWNSQEVKTSSYTDISTEITTLDWMKSDLTPVWWTPDIQPGWVGKKGNLPPCLGTPNSSNVMLWPSMKT
ncbi:hypothetical protein, partial [Rothia nasimurium]|uniref:hypothetical protein n=1 Tax=Rothia nasimurium TaxID=85336 RepID=UPI001F4775F6